MMKHASVPLRESTVICCAVIEAQRLSIRFYDMSAGKDDIPNIAHALVVFFGGEHPLIATDQAGLGGLKLEKRQSQPV